MPTFSTIEQLIAHIAANMTVNGAQENTGARTQALLNDIANSLIAIIGAAPEAAGSIQPWDEGLEYTDQVIVSHNGSLWLYAGGAPNTGTEPGTDDAVWMSLVPPAPYGATDSWLDPVATLASAPPTPAEGLRCLITEGATGVFAGRSQQIATYTGGAWQYYLPQSGDVVTCDGAMYQYASVADKWLLRSSLSSVLSVGNTTDGIDVEISEPGAVAFRNNGFLMRLIGQDIAEDHTVNMPDDDGTLATLEQVNALLTALNLQAILVNGNETSGRSIQVSEFDGINFLQGTNYVRVKAPAVAAAARTLLLPDKSGTVATTDDVAAVAALVDGALRAPEAYTPSGGLYPATFGGAAIQKGDTFRCGAGTMGARTVDGEDLLIALVDTPGQTDGNWQVIESNRVVATQAEAEDSASTDTAKLMPPKRWWQAWTKGLTLTAFANAVRGMLLTGYSVGANIAVAATDGIMGAIGKLQGQINATNTAVSGKLAKASNLSDVTSASSARTNLGLKALATQDYADAVVGYAAIGIGESLAKGDVVVVLDDGLAWKATPANCAGKRVAMVVANPVGGYVKLQYAGIITLAPTLTVGSPYFLDPVTPGGIKPTRPANAIYVGTAINLGQLDFRPALPLPSGAVALASDESTTTDLGMGVSMQANLVPGGIYEVNVYATVSASVGAGRCRVYLIGEGAARGRLQYATSSTDPTTDVDVTSEFISAPDSSPIASTEGDYIECQLTALVVVDEHTTDPWGVAIAPMNNTYNATIRAGSVMTWNRIG